MAAAAAAAAANKSQTILITVYEQNLPIDVSYHIVNLGKQFRPVAMQHCSMKQGIVRSNDLNYTIYGIQ
jgi:hypothetical protein